MNIDITMQESTTLAVTMYASETGLSKRVAQWEEKIKPILDDEVYTYYCLTSLSQQL